MNPAEELELIKGCLRNDRKAQRQLYQQYKVQLFRLCLRYGKNRVEAEDMLQEGFITIFRDLKYFTHKGPLGGWMRKVVINCCLQYIRKNNKKQYWVEMEEFPDIEEEAIELPTSRLQELTQLIQKLPSGYRTVFNLYVLEGYTHKEIAQVLSIHINTSKSQLSKAKKMLRKLLETKMVS